MAARNEMRALISAISARNPGLLQRALLSANEKRRILRERGLSVRAGTAIGELGLVSFGPELHEAIVLVLTKLARALHYKHTGRSAPAAAEIDVWVRSNVDIMGEAGDALLEIVDGLPGAVATVRSGKSLSDQFSYRYGVTEDDEHSMFVCQFNQSMVAALLVATTPLPDVD